MEVFFSVVFNIVAIALVWKTNDTWVDWGVILLQAIFLFYQIYNYVENKQIMLSNISNKDKKKFDIALINSCVVYWYMKNMDGSYDIYMDRINNYLEWMESRPSDRTKYNAMKFVKDFINKHKLTDDFLREYCFNLEYNNPREEWNKKLRKQIMTVAELIEKLKTLPQDYTVTASLQDDLHCYVVTDIYEHDEVIHEVELS